ncbi:MAG: hypothetical protein CR968_03610 [Flavobacteriia bacterium]|nr:MAG: hypothetical protein CR968_03610 [Flavobacteriia bacterium]
MMKKILLVVALIAGTTMYAQDIQLGAKAGLNIAGYHGEDAVGGKPLYSFHVGPVAEFMFTDKFSVQPELLYSQVGSEIIDRKGSYSTNLDETTIVTATTNTNGDTKVNYLILPIMGKYDVYKGIHLELGPQLGFLLSKKTSTTTTLTWPDTLPAEILSALPTSSEGTDTNTDDLAKLDIGLNVGVSYKLDSGVFLGARYNYGFNNYYKNTNEFNDDLKNQTVQISLGFMF